MQVYLHSFQYITLALYYFLGLFLSYSVSFYYEFSLPLFPKFLLKNMYCIYCAGTLFASYLPLFCNLNLSLYDYLFASLFVHSAYLYICIFLSFLSSHWCLSVFLIDISWVDCAYKSSTCDVMYCRKRRHLYYGGEI
jgi:hypothetical protein